MPYRLLWTAQRVPTLEQLCQTDTHKGAALLCCAQQRLRNKTQKSYQIRSNRYTCTTLLEILQESSSLFQISVSQSNVLRSSQWARPRLGRFQISFMLGRAFLTGRQIQTQDDPKSRPSHVQKQNKWILVLLQLYTQQNTESKIILVWQFWERQN